MSKSIRMGQTLSLLTAVMAAMTICWVAGCAKKSGREAVPETHDTLTVISDTLSKMYDTLSETPDTLSKISGTLTGKRDGKTYKTVTIGKQAWMAENLNYATSSGSWCYENDPSNCDKYGRLYDWNTAMSVCPTGWHLPSREEWDVLAQAVGGRKHENSWPAWHVWEDAGDKLGSTSGWYENYGTDEYGFSALPGGNRSYSGGSFNNAGYYGSWWTATEDGSGDAYYRYKYYGNDHLYEHSNNDKDDGFSVRCVRNRSASGASSQKSVSDDMVKVDMVFVKGGTFMMGCTSEQGIDCADNEKSAHSVTVGDFYIGKYEVTQGLWKAVMGDSNNPSYFTRNDKLPVEYVSWKDIAGKDGFIEILNNITGKKYRLPTEAEWEYAARGGANGKGYKYSRGDNVNDAAWHVGDVVYSIVKRQATEPTYVLM